MTILRLWFKEDYKFYLQGEKGNQETPEEREKRLYCTIPKGTMCEVDEVKDNKAKIQFNDPSDGQTKYLSICLHCAGGKAQLLLPDDEI